MANPYADPTSIDYILQRAQDELRRGESQHYRAAEAQYTNHVKELLGNLERYLETCGVQLPNEVITGAEATAAAAAAAAEAAAVSASAAYNDVNASSESVRSPFSSQLRSGFLNQKRSYPSLQNRSLSTSAAAEAGRGYRDSVTVSVNAAMPRPLEAATAAAAVSQPRVGWSTLATPTEAQQLDCPDEVDGGAQRLAPVSTGVGNGIRRTPSESSPAGLMTSLGSNNNNNNKTLYSHSNLAVQPKVLAEAAAGRSEKSGTDAEGQRTPQRLAGPPSPHSPPGGGAANPTVAPLDATPVREGLSFSMVTGGGSPLVAAAAAEGRSGSAGHPRGSPLPLRHQQRTPHTESLGHSGNPHSSPEAAIAHARSVSLNAVAAGSGAHMGSGTENWPDFGQFVQSITESRVNSNLTSLQSAAAAVAAYSLPVGYIPSIAGSGGGNAAAHPGATAVRSHESTTTTTTTTTSTTTYTVNAAAQAAMLETGFQLPHVLVTATSPMSPSIKDLLPGQQHQSQPAASRQPHPCPQSQRSAPRGGSSPLGIGAAAISSNVAEPDSASAQEESSQQHPTITTEITSISSRSPSLPLQAAYGTGSNAVRALAATTATSAVAEADGEKGNGRGRPMTGNGHAAATARDIPPSSAVAAWGSPGERVPTPPQHRRSSLPSAPVPGNTMTGVPVPLERAASLPANVDYLPYGKGGSPSYPHILRVCTSATSSTPKTQLNSPSQPLSRRSSVPTEVASPFVTTQPLPQQQQQSRLSAREAEDGAVVVTTTATTTPVLPPPRRADDGEFTARSQEKEQLIRRLRGILDKSASPSTTPSGITSYADIGQRSPSMNGAAPAHEAWAVVKTPPATAPYAVVISPLREEEGDADVADTTEDPPWRQPQQQQPPARAAGLAYVRPVAVQSVPSYAPPPIQQQEQQQHPLGAHNLSDGGARKVEDVQDSHRHATPQPSSNAYGVNLENSGAPHATSPTYANVNLNTPSSKDMGSLPTGLYSASRRTMLSHDTSSGGGVTNGTRTTNPSPHHPGRQLTPPQQQQPLSAAPPGPPSSSYTTAYSNTLPAYAASTVAPPPSSSHGALPAAARMHNGGSEATPTRRVDSTASSVGSGGTPQQSRGETSREEKQLLMQRLRMMLGRSDD